MTSTPSDPHAGSAANKIALEALQEIADSDFSFEGHACLHCEMALDAIKEIKRRQYLVEPLLSAEDRA